MAELIERREYTPKRFYAGEFPAVPETGTAGGAIALHDLVMSSDPVVYIMTGEVFADSVGLDGITVDEAKAACRKLSIFLK